MPNAHDIPWEKGTDNSRTQKLKPEGLVVNCLSMQHGKVTLDGDAALAMKALLDNYNPKAKDKLNDYFRRLLGAALKEATIHKTEKFVQLPILTDFYKRHVNKIPHDPHSRMNPSMDSHVGLTPSEVVPGNTPPPQDTPSGTEGTSSPGTVPPPSPNMQLGIEDARRLCQIHLERLKRPWIPSSGVGLLTFQMPENIDFGFPELETCSHNILAIKHATIKNFVDMSNAFDERETIFQNMLDLAVRNNVLQEVNTGQSPIRQQIESGDFRKTFSAITNEQRKTSAGHDNQLYPAPQQNTDSYVPEVTPEEKNEEAESVKTGHRGVKRAASDDGLEKSPIRQRIESEDSLRGLSAITNEQGRIGAGHDNQLCPTPQQSTDCLAAKVTSMEEKKEYASLANLNVFDKLWDSLGTLIFPPPPLKSICLPHPKHYGDAMVKLKTFAPAFARLSTENQTVYAGHLRFLRYAMGGQMTVSNGDPPILSCKADWYPIVFPMNTETAPWMSPVDRTFQDRLVTHMRTELNGQASSSAIDSLRAYWSNGGRVEDPTPDAIPNSGTKNSSTVQHHRVDSSSADSRFMVLK
ncbi:hypothetical protein BD410DRAFT_810411 [Rickenella mellea]|uniref:Uncharacterized protein n=1 Tax=Rickenella mellea TaxID=50990 RepID=A0A4Y7PE08_9AGAM|nr:hypothetical protein BD410DRAFT_810411 [Rickenella mellea]